MNKKVSRVIAITLTLAVITIVFYSYLPVTKSIVKTMDETVGENKVDILFVGSSHTFNGINPIQMYEDFGFAAYDLAIGAQAPWQSYYYIKEACKTQHPKLIVYDTYMLGNVQDVEEQYQDYQTVNNLLYCPFSLNHLEAVMQSEAESRLSLILRFPYTYNKRDGWTGFTLEKYYGEEDYSLGYSPRVGTTFYKDFDVTNVNERARLNPKNEKFLLKIIDFCEEQGISLLLTNAPWPDITEEKQKNFNEIFAIADNYGINYVDGCHYYEDMGIDCSEDFYGGGHLNHKGVTKYTAWMEQYISKNYSIDDRRGNPDYKRYEEAVKWMKEWENQNG